MSYGLGSNQGITTQKLRQEIVVKLIDGSVFLGRIFLGYNERVVDLLNGDRSFIPLELETKQVILIAVKSIICVDLFQPAAENASKFDNVMAGSCLYQTKNNILEKSEGKSNNIEDYCTKIYGYYNEIVTILESKIFRDKIKEDVIFEENILKIIDLLRQSSYVIENNNV